MNHDGFSKVGKSCVNTSCRKIRPPQLSSLSCPGLGQEVFDHVAVNIGQSVVTSLETIAEFFVIEAEQVHPGGLQVMDMHLVACHREAELVGLTV